MKSEKILTVVKAPHTSEKAVGLADSLKQVVFKVSRDSTKSEIKQAVEELFNVKVKNVNVVNSKGKTKSFAQRRGRRNHTKKAYVSLHEGYDIEFATTE